MLFSVWCSLHMTQSSLCHADSQFLYGFIICRGCIKDCACTSLFFSVSISHCQISSSSAFLSFTVSIPPLFCSQAFNGCLYADTCLIHVVPCLADSVFLSLSPSVCASCSVSCSLSCPISYGRYGNMFYIHRTVKVHIYMYIYITVVCAYSFLIIDTVFILPINSCEGACFQCWTAVRDVMVHAGAPVPSSC